MDYYAACKAAGCEIDNHESDLYVKMSMKSAAITKGAPNRSFFTSQIDGKTWIEIPFGYTPFWDKVSARSR